MKSAEADEEAVIEDAREADEATPTPVRGAVIADASGEGEAGPGEGDLAKAEAGGAGTADAVRRTLPEPAETANGVCEDDDAGAFAGATEADGMRFVVADPELERVLTAPPPCVEDAAEARRPPSDPEGGLARLARPRPAPGALWVARPALPASPLARTSRSILPEAGQWGTVWGRRSPGEGRLLGVPSQSPSGGNAEAAEAASPDADRFVARVSSGCGDGDLIALEDPPIGGEGDFCVVGAADADEARGTPPAAPVASSATS